MQTRIPASTRGEGAIVAVPSASRPGFKHFVDVERQSCSCKGYSVHKHCRHVALFAPIATATISAHEKGQVGKHAMYATAEGYRFVTEHLGRRRVKDIRRSVCKAYTEQHARSHWSWLVGDSIKGARVLHDGVKEAA